MKENKEKSFFNYVVIAAVLIIPFMYSFFYLKAYWDPYGKGNIDNLPVAVVNLDKGDRGEQLVDSIKEKDTLKLTLTNASSAEEGLYDKSYYAVITIPEDFTSSMESIKTENKKHPTITYAPNQKSNYLASQIIDKVLTVVEKNLDNTINSEIVSTLSDNLESVPNELGTISTGFAELNKGTNELAKGTNSLKDGAITLNTGYKQFDGGLNELQGGLNKVNSSMKTFNDGMNQLVSQVSQLGVLKDQIPVLTGSVNNLAAGSEQFNTQLNSYVSSINGVIEVQIKNIQTQINAYGDGCDTDATCQFLKKNLGQLQLLKGAGGQLINGYGKLNTGISTLNKSVLPLNALPEQFTQLTNGLNKLQSGSNQITLGVEKLNNGVNTLYSNSGKIKSGISTLSDGSKTLNSGAQLLNNSVTSANKEINDKIDTTKSEIKKVESLEDYSKAPVNVKTKEVNKVSSYGTAFSPFFISIALWVGCLMMYIVLYYDRDNRFKKLSINNNNHLQRTGLYHLLATATSVILGLLLQLLLDFEITNLFVYYASMILIGNTFMAIIELLIVNFKDVGKFIALILLVLQLSASGGTFPIETVTSGFRWLNPILPMTYTINILKECLISIEPSLLSSNLLVVVLILVVAVTVNIIQDIRFQKKNN